MIPLHGEVNQEMVTKLAEALADKVSGEILISLVSDGGDIYSALAIYSMLRRGRLPVTVFADGMVASAAVLILAAGDKRVISPEAHIMLHENALEDLTAYTDDFKAETAQLEKLEDQICNLLSKRTKTSYYSWISLHKGTKYIDANYALELGLVDEIIKGCKDE